MKTIYFLILLVILMSCGPSQDELAKEKQHIIDSINTVNENQRIEEEKMLQKHIQDSIAIANRTYEVKELAGEWSVNMTCTNSDCPNAKEGDIKSESWFISVESGKIKVKTIGNSSTNNIYEGSFDGKNLKLAFDVMTTETGFLSSTTQKTADVKVKAKMISTHEMKGIREVLNQTPCKITYEIQMKKK